MGRETPLAQAFAPFAAELVEIKVFSTLRWEEDLAQLIYKRVRSAQMKWELALKYRGAGIF